ncbi:MAG TPA: hypothetical protein VGI40_07745 [Pirellulaceae bacterium]
MNTSRTQYVVAIFALGFVLLAGTAGAQTAVVRPVVPPVPAAPETAAVVTAPATVAAVSAPAGSEIAVRGQVLRTKQVDLRGTADKNLAALVDIGNGQRQIVELGLASNFRLTPVVTGEPIAIRGHQVRVGQLDVLVASLVAIGGKDVVIQRETAPATVAAVVPAGYPVTEQIVKIEARVNRLRTSRLNGSRQEHLVAELVTRGGQAIVTDLGPPEQIWRADVKQGEWIMVRGQEMRVDNRPVLLALEINKNGVPVLVDRHIVRGEPLEAIEPTPVAETAAVIRRPAVVTPPTTLVPGTTVEQTTPVEVVAPRVSPLPVVP